MSFPQGAAKVATASVIAAFNGNENETPYIGEGCYGMTSFDSQRLVIVF
jgi:hypothetical protein